MSDCRQAREAQQGSWVRAEPELTRVVTIRAKAADLMVTHLPHGREGESGPGHMNDAQSMLALHRQYFAEFVGGHLRILLSGVTHQAMEFNARQVHPGLPVPKVLVGDGSQNYSPNCLIDVTILAQVHTAEI